MRKARSGSCRTGSSNFRRVCGGTWNCVHEWEPDPGLSPRVWRHHNVPVQELVPLGAIPAYAGGTFECLRTGCNITGLSSRVRGQSFDDPSGYLT